MKELILLQPDGGEQALEAIKLLASEKAADLIILDSIVACVPASELEGELADMNIGRQAKLFSSFFKQVTPALEMANCALICTNQVRQAPGKYGDASVLPCGEAQKFFASIICRTRRQQSQKEENKEGDIVANQISVSTEKNKLAPPFRKAEIMIYYGKGFSADNEMFDMAVEFGIIEKAGGWFKYNGENIGQGSIKAKTWLEEHSDIKDLIMNKVKEILMQPNTEKMALQDEESELDYDPETGEVFE
jgi:recombination protein RecA